MPESQFLSISAEKLQTSFASGVGDGIQMKDSMTPFVMVKSHQARSYLVGSLQP